MTTGYPDAQSYAQWRGAALVNQFVQSFPAGSTNYGPFYIGDFESLYVYSQAGAQNQFIQLNFYDDAGSTRPLQTLSFEMFAQATLAVVVPAYGNYVTVRITNQGAVATTATLYVQPNNIATAVPRYLGQASNTALAQVDQSIGASSTVTITVAPVVAGPAAMTALNANTASWHVVLQFWDSAGGVWRNSAGMDGKDGSFRKTVKCTLPPTSVQFLITNDDSSAHTFQGTLWADP